MNALLVLLSLSSLVLLVAAQNQEADPDRAKANKKDKRGLLGVVVGYDQLAPHAYPGGAVDAYSAYTAYGTYGAAPYAYGPYRTAAAAPYAAPLGKVAYTPYALPVPAYGAYADGAYSKAGAYAGYAPYGPYGYVAEGYQGYAVPAHYGGVISAPLAAAGHAAYAY